MTTTEMVPAGDQHADQGQAVLPVRPLPERRLRRAMVFSVIYLRPRAISISHCEACGLTHPHEETNCVASKYPYKNVNSSDPYDMGGHCVHWWDAEPCCWCGDDPCAAARCALG